MTTFKNTIFIGLLPFSIFFFFFFCFYFSNIRKNKNAIFFSKSSFWDPPNFAKTLFWHNVTLFVLSKMPPKHYKLGKTSKNLDQFLTYSLDQFLTYKRPNLGPVFNSTAYIYICIYVYMYIYIYVCVGVSLSLSLSLYISLSLSLPLCVCVSLSLSLSRSLSLSLSLSLSRSLALSLSRSLSLYIYIYICVCVSLSLSLSLSLALSLYIYIYLSLSLFPSVMFLACDYQARWVLLLCLSLSLVQSFFFTPSFCFSRFLSPGCLQRSQVTCPRPYQDHFSTPNPQVCWFYFCPDLLFLAFLEFLAFFLSMEFLVFLCVFPSFPRILGVRRREKILVFWWFSSLILLWNLGQKYRSSQNYYRQSCYSWEFIFPQITVTVTVLKFGWISITVTVLASAVTPSFPLIPNYRLESHLN